MWRLCLLFPAVLAAAEPTSEEVFNKRILPILRSDKPSSCVQCHLSAVDLKDYLRPGADETFASLRDQGLIDLEKPDESKILRLIRMDDGAAGADALVARKTRVAELAAFGNWIKSAAADPRMRALAKAADDKISKPVRPVEVIRHVRTDRLAESFEQTIWPMRFRCMNCHTQGAKESEKHVGEHGERVAWFRKDGPAATMRFIIENGLIDTKNPEKSLLLRKPLNEVKHAGGKKFLGGDQGHQAFKMWIDDYVRSARNEYVTAESLPKPSAAPLLFGSDIRLKLVDCPPEWAGKLLQIDVFAWDAARGSWEDKPVATVDRDVWGKAPGPWAQDNSWQHTLNLLAPAGSERAKAWRKDGAALPSGRYLLKAYLDAKGRLMHAGGRMGDDDFVGQAAIETDWARKPPGTLVSAKTIAK